MPLFSCIQKEMFLVGVCFKIINFMRNQSLFFNFKHNIFQTKILANAAFILEDDFFMVFLSDFHAIINININIYRKKIMGSLTKER